MSGPGSQLAEASHPTRIGRPSVEQGGYPPDMPEREGARRGYRVESFLSVLGAPELLYDVQGSHLYVQEMTGSDIVAVRLDSERNGWIEVEEGDTIVRDYQRFWVRSNARGNRVANLNTQTKVTFISSDGPVVLRAPKKYGFRDGFFSLPVLADPTGFDAFSPANFLAAYTPVGSGVPSHLKYGGTIIVDNRDPAVDAFMYMGIAGGYTPAGTGVYPDMLTATRIPFNSQLAFVVENRLVNLFPNPGTGGENSLIFACEAGTVQLVVTLSRLAFDYTDAETLAATGAPPLKES